MIEEHTADHTGSPHHVKLAHTVLAAFGALLFGRLADTIGHHAIYGLTLVVLAIGAIAAAFCRASSGSLPSASSSALASAATTRSAQRS